MKTEKTKTVGLILTHSEKLSLLLAILDRMETQEKAGVTDKNLVCVGKRIWCSVGVPEETSPTHRPADDSPSEYAHPDEAAHLQTQLDQATHALVALQSRNDELVRARDEAIMGEKIPKEASDVNSKMVKACIKDDCYANAKPFTIHDVASYFSVPVATARNRVYYLWHGCGNNAPWAWFRQNFRTQRQGKHYVYYPNTYKYETVARVTAMGTPSGTAVKLEGCKEASG